MYSLKSTSNTVFLNFLTLARKKVNFTNEQNYLGTR